MNSKPLTYEETLLTCNDNSHVSLRPTLRAACYLERLHDGFPGLFSRLEQSNLATIREVIMQAASSRQEAKAFLSELEQLPLRHVAEITVSPLLALCTGFFPKNDQNDSKKAKPSKAVKPVTMQDVYSELFAIGTGILGWTPNDTWNATPSEIVAAGKSRNHFISDILKAVFGAPEGDSLKVDQYTDEQLAQIEQEGTDPNFDRAAFADLKASL